MATSKSLFGRRKDELAAARAAAATARDGMTEALYDLEGKRRGMAVRAEFAALDGSAEGRRWQADFATLAETIDALSQAYVTILAGHETGETVRQLRGAEAAFNAFRDRLSAASAQLADFEQRSAAQVGRVEARFARSRDALRDATEQLQAARTALDAAASAGLHSVRAAAALQDAERRLAQARAAADRYADIDRVVRLATQAADQAREAARLAGELPGLRAKTSTRLASLRTRLQAVAGRTDSVDRALSELRRRYTYAAFADLADSSSVLAARTEQGRLALEEATRLAAAQEWEPATEASARASAALSAGDAAAHAVLDRVARLAAVATDPGQPLNAARFAVRDAQRLLLSRGPVPPEHFVRDLDGLAARLDRAPAVLTGPHPDYWAYLQIVDGVEEEVRSAVARIRQWIAVGH